MKQFKKGLRILLRIILGFLAFVLTYALCALILSVIPVNRHPVSGNDVSIFIITNGDHTDVVMPVKNDQVDWSQTISFRNTISKDTAFKYLAIGWGDKGFFLNTPTWAQLKFSVAFKAATGLSTSALHATFYNDADMRENNNCIRINISKDQYTGLIAYIKNSFRNDSAGHVINIPTTAQYGRNDAFYEAKRRYSIFYTCNTWANNALKSAGQKAAVWTPFDRGIFYHYR